VFLKPLAPPRQDAHPSITMFIPTFTRVAIGVLEPIQMVLKRPVVLGDQGRGLYGLE
jgi:hypothetical protein